MDSKQRGRATATKGLIEKELSALMERRRSRGMVGAGDTLLIALGTVAIGTVVGTLVGAIGERHERLGDENMFLFGLHADEVVRLKREGYAPQKLYARDENLRAVIDKLKAGFSDGVSYDDLASRLLMNDEYMLLQDFASYCAAEQRMADTYARSEEWNRMSLINIARSGIFAADRAVAQYADTIWHVPHK